MAHVRFEKVEKRYDDFVAVEDFSLSISDGEFIVLVGPSGCGKSSSLRMLAGLEEITSGNIFVGDQCVNDIAPGKRDLAMVFQNYALYPHMTVRENMSFGLKMRKTPRVEIIRLVEEAAAILSITPLLNRRPAELSGGQRQRVAVGRAIVRQPAAFLFDEPLSNLDARLRVQMRKELAELHHRLKTTTIYVTHDQVEAMTLGHRIVVMDQGRIQQIAKPMEIYERPANRFVASFLGSPSMNLVDGNLRMHSGELTFQSGDIKFACSHAHPGKTGSVDKNAVTLGFRPEHLTLDSSAPFLTTATIDLVERFGESTVIYFKVGQASCVARIEGNPAIQRGEKVPIHLPTDKALLFDDHMYGELLFQNR